MVHQPSAPFPLAGALAAQVRVEEGEAITAEAECEATEVRHEPPIAMIEADEHVATRTHQGGDALEGAPGMGRVVQHAVGDDEVEASRLEDGPEEGHLQEVHPRQVVRVPEGLPQPE